MIPKFRAWIKKEERMAQVMSLHFIERGDLTGVNTYPEMGCLSIHFISDVVLMQSTGLKDCNDKEIYEGDILKISDGMYEIDEKNPFVVVKWDEEAGGYTMKDFTGEFDALNIGWQIADKLVRVEVVGNIYENPELLKGV